MGTNRQNDLLFLAFFLVGLAYVFVGIIAAHPFDDAIYAFNSQMFYYLHGSPFLSLPQGTFLDAINIAGYFPIALLTLFLKSNVLFIQIGVKIPYFLFTFLSSYILCRKIKRITSWPIAAKSEEIPMNISASLLLPLIIMYLATIGIPKTG